MALLDIIKGSGISVSGWLTSRLEPYQEFTRPVDLPPTSVPINDLAWAFYDDLTSGAFSLRGGTIIQGRLSVFPDAPADLGDQAIWHGYVTAMQALAYRLNPSLDNDARLQSYVHGLRDQQPQGILMRGLDDKGNIRWDASNDSATGHLAGLVYAWIYGSTTVRGEAVLLLDIWASSLISNKYALINPDGKPTTYGQLEDGWKTDPLRLTLLLAILITAYYSTGDKLYRIHYDALKLKYTPLLAAPPFRAFGLEKYPDLHRGAMHLSILAEMDFDNYYYLSGLRQYQRMGRYHGNVLILALCAKHLGVEPIDRKITKKVLSEFSFATKTTNPGRQLSLTWPEKAKWPLIGGQWVSRQPIPKWRKRAQDNEWARHPYSLDSGLNGDGPDSRFHGGDYLMAYYLARERWLVSI